MSERSVSVDEFLNARKGFVKSGGVLVKAATRAPSSWDPNKRSARFVMSAEVEDRDKDIIVQEGLALDEFLKNPIAPFSHASNTFPVGTWSEVEKVLNGRPKRTEGTLTLVPSGVDGVADRLAFHLGAGTVRACSIGFIPKQIQRREAPQDPDGYRYPGYMILEAELVECSPVCIPSNPAALAKSAAEGDVLAREIIEQVLDEWAKDPATGLLMPREEFERAQKDATGNRVTIVVDKTWSAEHITSHVQAEVAKATAKPDPAADEAGLFRRFLSWLAGDGIKTDVARQAATILVDEAEKAAQAAAERKALEEEVTALEGRLAAKGI
jgi:phage head maturation protease